jgi:hypothetical protein
MAYIVEGLTKAGEGEGSVRRIAECNTLEAAISTAQQTVDNFLTAWHYNGRSAEELFSKYEQFGEVPIIFQDDESTMNVTAFNHIQYAKLRCRLLCIGSDSGSAL